jgi:hypothetical protein
MVSAITYDILSKCEDLKAIIGENIFPIVAPIDTEGDYITYLLTGCSPDYTKTRRAVITDFQMEFVVSSEDADRVVAIAQQLIKTLEDSRQTEHFGYQVQSVHLTNMKEAVTEDATPIRILFFNFKLTKL